jgi:hypothetical protein
VNGLGLKIRGQRRLRLAECRADGKKGSGKKLSNHDSCSVEGDFMRSPCFENAYQEDREVVSTVD